MDIHGWIAMVLGVFFSCLVGFGLMALMFFSSRKGYDEPPTYTQENEESTKVMLSDRSLFRIVFASNGPPEPHCSLISADDKVELRRSVTTLSGVVERVQTHLAGHAAAGRMAPRHIAAVADVLSSSAWFGRM